MAFLFVTLWVISICTSEISFILMLHGKPVDDVCKVMIEEIVRDGHHEYFAKKEVNKKLKRMKRAAYFLGLIPVMNILQVYALYVSIQTGQIKEVLTLKF